MKHAPELSSEHIDSIVTQWVSDITGSLLIRYVHCSFPSCHVIIVLNTSLW